MTRCSLTNRRIFRFFCAIFSRVFDENRLKNKVWGKEVKRMSETRNSSLLRKITLLIVICCLALPVKAKYGGGKGEPNDPYQIADYNDLYALTDDTNNYNKCFIMTADIDLDPCLPGRTLLTTALIASDVNNGGPFDGTPFTGTFDGNGHVISNLTIVGGHYLGLFGRTGSSSKISNLGMQDVDITGNSIEDFALGGLVGWNYGRIDNCYATGSVIGGDGCESIGGLAGECFGLGQGSSSIVNCYAICSVTGGAGSSSIGGLVGDGGGIITNCYAAGTVTGHGSIGGLNGTIDATITNCYFLTPDDGGGPDNGQGEPLTIEQMKHQSSFVGWDFIKIWNIGENQTYPYLRIYLPSDINKDGIVNFLDLSITANQWLQEQ
jgi:hypothetical protein